MQDKYQLSHWDKLWTSDDYYAYHNIPLDTDGISQLLLYALNGALPYQTMLEIGAGPGTRSIPIAKERNLRLSLVDLLESAHYLARKRSKRYGIECEYITGDALDIPVDDKTYDYTCSIGLNEHFFGEDRKKSFSEMYRVTKTGGKTIVIVPNKFGSVRLEQAIKEFTGTWTFGPTDLFSYGELNEIMESTGFSKVEMYGVSVYTQLVRLLPRDIQRKIFKNEKIWSWLVNLPGNFNVNSPINQHFGEEIMAIGYK